jgi:MFS family permease
MSLAARLYLVHVTLLIFSIAIWGLLFNLAMLAFGFPREFLGLLNMVVAGTTAVASLPLWWLTTRIGLRNALLVNSIVQALAIVALGMFPNQWVILVAMSCAGAATVLFTVAAQPFLMEQSDATVRDRIFSANAAIIIGVGGLGSLVAGSLPGWLAGLLNTHPESALAYRATFLVAGVGLGVAMVPLLAIRSHTSPSIVSTQPTAGFPALQLWPLGSLIETVRALLPAPLPMLFRLILPPFLVSWGAALFIPYLNLFFKERFAISDALLGVVFAGLGIATGLTSLAAPALARRFGRMPAIVITQIASLPFLIALGFLGSFWLAVGAALARVALYNLGWPLYEAFALERVPEHARPTMIGLINGAQASGYVLMPTVSIWVQQHYGFTPLFLVAAGCYTLAAGLIYWFFVAGNSDHKSDTNT